MTRQTSGGEEPYLEIANWLREKITTREFAPGQKLPSINELRQMFPRSQVTIQRAYKLLENEGLVESTPKVGYFVREYPTLRYHMARINNPTRLTGLPAVLDGWTKDVESAGYVGRQDIRVESVLGSTRLDLHTVGELLEIGADDIAVLRARVRQIAVNPRERNFKPESLANSYYPLELAKAADLTRPGSVNTAKALADLGHPQVHFTHEVGSRMPTLEEARKLRLPGGSSVLERITVARDPRERPVYIQHVVAIGNAARYIIEVDHSEETNTP